MSLAQSQDRIERYFASGNDRQRPDDFVASIPVSEIIQLAHRLKLLVQFHKHIRTNTLVIDEKNDRLLWVLIENASP